jgi:hypothetical protein
MNHEKRWTKDILASAVRELVAIVCIAAIVPGSLVAAAP